MPEILKNREGELITRLQTLIAKYDRELAVYEKYKKEKGESATREIGLMYAEAIKILASIDPTSDEGIGKMTLLESALLPEKSHERAD